MRSSRYVSCATCVVRSALKKLGHLHKLRHALGALSDEPPESIQIESEQIAIFVNVHSVEQLVQLLVFEFGPVG